MNKYISMILFLWGKVSEEVSRINEIGYGYVLVAQCMNKVHENEVLSVTLNLYCWNNYIETVWVRLTHMDQYYI